MKLKDLLYWKGTIGRGPYALIGLAGFAIKHNLDRIVATNVFGRPWGFFNYWVSPVDIFGPEPLPPEDAQFLLVMVAMALPFIWVGVVLTLKRLRAVSLPSWCVSLFFLPFLNLLFFLLLSVLPAREPQASENPPRWLESFIPEHPVGSAALGVLGTTLAALPVVLLATETLTNYGLGLFVGVPFCLGLVPVLIHGHHEPRTLGLCLLQSTLAVLLTSALLLALAIEGVVCIVMAAPMALPLAWFGGFIGYLIQRRNNGGRRAAQVYPALLLALPALITAEHAVAPEPPTFAVHTSLEIDAPPADVWRQVVAFTEIPEPTEWIFRLGIAYPIRAEIQGSGPGAERHCIFSTGAFVEPIQVWDEPRLLKFSVSANPPPMEEWTPYRAVYPTHLDGFLVSNGGQFHLQPLPGGRTRLEGTTWYRHGLSPTFYWKVWSDAIIHRIHVRVLRHIKTHAES